MNDPRGALPQGPQAPFACALPGDPPGSLPRQAPHGLPRVAAREARAELTILVTGATGQQGGATAARLLADGWRVRALTRDANGPAAKALAAAGAEVVTGDLLDRASLDAAASGAYGVFSVQPTPGMPGLPPGYGPAEEVRAGVNVAEAALAAGAGHLVYASAFGADQNPELSTLRTKAEIEERIRALGLSATVLRPASFMENLAHPVWGLREGALATPYAPGTRQQLIALEDIAGFAAAAFAEPERWRGRALSLAGDTLTPVEQAAAISRALGREVPYTQLPLAAIRARSEEAARGIASLNEGRYALVDVEELRALRPGLLDFGAWLERTGAARLSALLDAAH
ncbi:NmrA family NAD(P)-binding protein [Streptomyces hoynatensis]|uniref:NAD-dependent epimerase/dehydratase family protein n=1 Tax=Streptomyces hoynatensis TaxID=1141874 RepID=A0A3A9Z4M4_9ACTN|nr:NmrA family NAD(P)-binding protein [Streptomyces hoynatensis]RKN43203.1 NAD-dependent epimerase/dehydratase family protein [Streptomyces hoynatensis]